MPKTLNSKTNEVNGIDLSNYVNFYNVETIDFFFLRNVRITIRCLESKYQGTEICEPLSEYL